MMDKILFRCPSCKNEQGIVRVPVRVPATAVIDCYSNKIIQIIHENHCEVLPMSDCTCEICGHKASRADFIITETVGK